MSKNYTNPTKVITGVNTRWSYANVWDPKSINGGAPKYSVSLIIPKSDTATVNKIKAAIQSAYEEGESKLKGNGKSVPALSIIKTPLRDGDLERPDDAAYAGCYFVNANSATAPGIVDAVFLGFAPPRGLASLCLRHCSTCVALVIRGMMICNTLLYSPKACGYY